MTYATVSSKLDPRGVRGLYCGNPRMDRPPLFRGRSAGAGFYAFVMATVAGGSFIGSLKGPMMRWSAGMAAAAGVIGFALGFVGPLLLEPDAPQGPLLGIFVTGPFGVILGALLGLVIGIVRQLTSSKPVRQSLV